VKRGPTTFDPALLGRREGGVWAAYYRHEWARLLAGAVGMMRAGFGLSWPRTLLGAWYVLRANQVWAPYPDNDPDAARTYMCRFYALVAADGGLDLNPAEAARSEVEWWRVHRIHQREHGVTEDDLAQALRVLYAYVHDVLPDAGAEAVEHRVAAMRLSDQWVAAGCARASPLLAEVRRELIASYTALRAAVAGPAQPRRSST
jgi:hypothetical protein